MDRLTYDFQIGGSHCWQVKGADNLECREVCQRQEDRGCTDCPIAKAFDRLSAYEETGLEPGEIEQLKGEVFGLRLDKQELEQYRALGPIARLRELAQADKECISPCTFCRFNPPSSGDGKPCCMCPAVAALRREQE